MRSLALPRPAAGQRVPWGRWLLISIVLAYIAILIVFPLLAILQGAFGQGIARFFAEVSNPQVWRSFWTTIGLSIGAVVLNGFFGIIIAWVLVRHRFPTRAFWNGLIDLPFVVSPVIAGYMIILLFGRRGWFAPVLEATDVRIVFALPGMLLATIFVSLPFVIRELMPVLQELGEEPEQTAYTLGASRWQTFLRVTLPNIRWGLLYGLTLTLARAMGEFGAVLVVGGAVSGVTETATLFIFHAMEERQYVGAYAASLVLAIVSILVLLGMDAFRRRSEVTG